MKRFRGFNDFMGDEEMRKRFIHSLRFKMLALITVIIVTASSLIGISSYYIAKQRLIEAGKLNLQHTVDGALAVVRQLHQQEEFKQLSGKDAKQQAADLLVGTKINNNKRDYKKSGFLYKENGYMFVYTSDQVAQVHPMGVEGQNMSEVKDAKGNAVIANLLKVAKADQPEDRFYIYPWKNEGETAVKDKIAYMTYFEPWDWYIGIGAYEDEFYEGLTKLKWMTFMVTLLSTIVASGILYISLRRYLVTIEQVSRAMQDVADGDLNVSIEESPGADEVHLLTTSFNDMTRQMQTVIKKVNETGEMVASSSQQLTASAEETKTAANEVTVSMQEVASGAENQLTSIEQTENAMVEMAKLLEKMTSQSAKVLKEMNQTSQEASTGSESLKRVTEQMNKIHQAVHGSTETVKRLENRSTEIGQIISVITGIADQTNLLALNAAIEAARAGEYGKGFAVVADEVRKLAEESKKSADEIGHMLKEIQQETKQVYAGMKMNTEDVVVGMDVVEEANEKFTKIIADILQVQSEIKVITNATSEVDHYSFKIMETIMMLSEVAKQSASSAETVAAASEEELAAMEEIVSASNSLSQLSQELQDLLNKFKI
ncbi:HAMP domain-containing protein [Priestia megaterium]|nr:HAMP domain-containing protein [Priestia megaterium]